MSIRWRADGQLLCGAKSTARPDDCYIDDRLHYRLSVELGVLIPCPGEHETGEWRWSDDPRSFWEDQALTAPPVATEPDLDITGRQEMIDAINARAEPEGERIEVTMVADHGEVCVQSIPAADATEAREAWERMVALIGDGARAILTILPTDTGAE